VCGGYSIASREQRTGATPDICGNCRGASAASRDKESPAAKMALEIPVDKPRKK
jgi:hypothetical protein